MSPNRAGRRWRQFVVRGWRAFARGWDLYLLATGYGATFLLLGIAALWLPDVSGSLADAKANALILEGAPDARHWFGLGPGGIDMMAPVLKGAGLSVWLALLATMLGTAAGVAIATVLQSLWFGRLLDGLMDAFTAAPMLILALMLAFGLGDGFGALTAIIGGCCAIPVAARCADWYRDMDWRGDVVAARAMGWTHWRLMGDRFLTRLWQRAAAAAAMLLPGALLAEAAVGFARGIGTDGAARLGHLIAAGQDHTLDAPWLLFWPGATLAGLTTLLAALAWAVRRTANEPVHERLW